MNENGFRSESRIGIGKPGVVQESRSERSAVIVALERRNDGEPPGMPSEL
jgi:hypothetical protein